MADPTQILPPLTEAALTSRAVGGAGLFDGLMEAVGAHLRVEFEKGRISGNDYANAWVASMQGALNTAAQFLLQKDQARYQAILVQAQVEKLHYEIEHLLPLQQAQLELQNDRLNFEVTELLPLEKTKALKQAEVMDAQIAGTEAQTAQTLYQTENLLPLEKSKGLKQIDAITAEISGLAAKTEQTLYETTQMLPAQKQAIEKDIAIKGYQLTDVLPAQVAGTTADTQGKIYNNNYLLPAQLESLKEQTEGHRSKTLDTRTDGTTVKGSVGVQKDLQKQQIVSFQRDAETKMTKMMLDAWSIQKSMDEGLEPPTAVTNTNISTAIAKVRTNLDL